MRKGVVGIAVIAILALLMIAGPTGLAEACAGGDPGVTYLDTDMAADGGGYDKLTMSMAEAREVELHKEGAGTLMVLTDEEMTRFEAGEEYEPVYESDEDYNWVYLDKGDYWVVLDNTEGPEAAYAEVDVYTNAEKCGEPPYPDPTYYPNYGFRFVVIAAGIAAGICIGVAFRTMAAPPRYPRYPPGY